PPRATAEGIASRGPEGSRPPAVDPHGSPPEGRRGMGRRRGTGPAVPRGAAVRTRLPRFPGGSAAPARRRAGGSGAPVPEREGRLLQRAGPEDGPVQGLPEPRYRCELQGPPGELRSEAQGPRRADRERQHGAPAPDGGDNGAVLCPRPNGPGVGRAGGALEQT